ncbi:2169_t:CDS:2 [Racocetra persica]|uniref:2169_t:CDS:1 n=1 Tax=Racocetra persica TaxID=160502 RepID=A0ACA9M0Z5_9GLOM|nr:2169_t:CDS:2 [Racocetra persica]
MYQGLFSLTSLTLCFFIFINQQSSVYSQYVSGNFTDAIPDLPKPKTCKDNDLKWRTYDGSCNNIENSNWGIPYNAFDRGYFQPNYKDKYTGEPWSKIDTRMISNLLGDSGQEPILSGSPLSDDLPSTARKSIFEIFFGQLVNHDIEDSPLSTVSLGISIANITDDPVLNTKPNNPFNPTKTPYMILSLSLGRIVDNVFIPVDSGNSYLDLSNIYGAKKDMADGLRTKKDGKLLLETYFGNGGAYNKALTNVTAERMAPSPGNTNVYPNLSPPSIRANDAMVAGDTRCSENIQLCIITTIWIREHNWWADKILNDDPSLKDNDEEIYQRARRMTIAEYQHVIINEYLPAVLGVQVPPYTGYNSSLRPETSIHFAGAAFRYGHSNVRPYNIIDGCTGQPIELHPDFSFPNSHPNRLFFVGKSVPIPPIGNYTAQQLDYTPLRMLTLASGSQGSGFDNILASMLRETAAKFDLMFTTALRNIPAPLDLFAVDIGRGRLLGLAPYDIYREAYHPKGGLYKNKECEGNSEVDSIECFKLITSNETVATNLQSIYKKVGQIDAIVGMFAEDMESPTAPLPPTISGIIMAEFIRKRSSDRFWYEGETYTDEEKSIIMSTSMGDIIMRNTNVRNIQVNPFKSPGTKDPLATVLCSEST